jgi:hypothetical protein
MPNKHYRRWIILMPFGFVVVAAAILIMMYSANRRGPDEWLMWGVISVAGVVLGLSLLGTAFIHKIKSDLIRKQRSKEKQAQAEDF